MSKRPFSGPFSTALMQAGWLIWLACGAAAAQDNVYVDDGACPGEGCRYGETWVATAAVNVYRQPARAGEPIAALEPGQSIETLTGQVHTVPGRFDVKRVHEDFSPGDEVYVLTYLGEGHFRVRHNGQIRQADLNFSPWGGSSGRLCDNEARCWGSLREQLQFDWWILIRADNGVEGWIVDTENFRTRVRQ